MQVRPLRHQHFGEAQCRSARKFLSVREKLREMSRCWAAGEFLSIVRSGEKPIHAKIFLWKYMINEVVSTWFCTSALLLCTSTH